jgi:thiol peroxidase
MEERINGVKFKNQSLTLLGPALKPGDAAPDFIAAASDLSPKTLKDFLGPVLLVLSVPSLDTSVCDQETRRFNEEASAFGDKARVLTISMDLPFAQSRWCGAAGVDRVVLLSDYKEHSFGLNYGVYIKEIGLLSRAVFLIDQHGIIRYVEYVPEVGIHPHYDQALAAVQSII